MERLQTYSIALFLLLLVGAAVRCSETDPETFRPQNVQDDNGNTANEDSEIVFGSPKINADYKAGTHHKTTEPAAFYDFSKRFVESAMAGGFPYDVATAFTSGTFGTDNIKAIVKSYIGYIIAVAVGIISLIALPIAACSFCCCRCAGRCGGRRVVNSFEEAGYQDSCGRFTAMGLLLVSLLVAIAGSGLMIQANNNISNHLEDLQSGELDKLDDLATFFDSLVQQANPAILGKYNFTVGVLRRDMDNIGVLLGQPVQSDILNKSNLGKTYEEILAVEEDAKALLSHLESLSTNGESFTVEADTVTKEYKGSPLKAFIDATSTASSREKTILTTFDTAMTGFLPIIMPKETASIDGLKDTLKGNISDKVKESRKNIDDVPEWIQTSTKSSRGDILKKMATYRGTISGSMDRFESLKSDVLRAVNFQSAKKSGEDFLKIVIKYDTYRWYAGLALACLALLIDVLLLFTLMFGAFGGGADVLPSERSGMSNCGGRLLLAGTLLTFFTTLFLMLLTTVLFTVSAPVYTVVCGPVNDLSVLDKLMNEYELFGKSRGDGTWLGDLIAPDANVSLGLYDVMNDCKNNKGIYSTLKLGEANLIKLDELLNYKKTFNIKSELGSLKVDFSGTSIKNTGLNNFLTFMAGFAIDYTAYTLALDKSPIKFIDAMVTNMNALPVTDITKKAIDLATTFKNEHTKRLQAEVIKIETSLAGAKDITDNMKTRCDSLKAVLLRLETELPPLMTESFKNGTGNFAERMEHTLDQFVGSLKKSITSELGRCSPLWNLYNDLLVQDACAVLLGSLNVWWCATGMTAVFLILTACVSCRFSKHLYRVDLADDEYDAVSRSTPSVPKSSSHHLFKNKVYNSDSATKKGQV